MTKYMYNGKISLKYMYKMYKMYTACIILQKELS